MLVIRIRPIAIPRLLLSLIRFVLLLFVLFVLIHLPLLALFLQLQPVPDALYDSAPCGCSGLIDIALLLYVSQQLGAAVRAQLNYALSPYCLHFLGAEGVTGGHEMRFAACDFDAIAAHCAPWLYAAGASVVDAGEQQWRGQGEQLFR